MSTQTDYCRQVRRAIARGRASGALTPAELATLARDLPTPAIRVADTLGYLLERRGVATWSSECGADALEAHLDFSVRPGQVGQRSRRYRVTLTADRVELQGDTVALSTARGGYHAAQLVAALAMVEEAGVFA